MTDENIERIDNSERKMDARLEPTVGCRKDDDSRQIRRLCENANVDSKGEEHKPSKYLSWLSNGFQYLVLPKR